MSTTEDQLRDTLHGIAALVREPAPHARRLPPRRPIRFVPVLVAAAMALVLLAGALVARSVQDTSGGPLAAPLAPSRYVVVLAESRSPGIRDGLEVRDVRSGKVLATLPLLQGLVTWFSVGATTDDRVFFVNGNTQDGGTLFRLELRDGGRIESLRKVADIAQDAQIAVKPDGTRVAVRGWGNASIKMPKDKREFVSAATPPRVEIINAADGRRTATFDARTPGQLDNLTWSGDGQLLGFQFHGAKPTKGQTGFWVFDPSLGRHWTESGRMVKIGATYAEGTSMTLDADGASVYMVTMTARPGYHQLVEIDVATGRQRRVLYERKYTNARGDDDILFTEYARDPRSGDLLLPVQVTRNDKPVGPSEGFMIDVRTGKITKVPFFGGEPPDLAW